ncbi:MAG: pseudouridine synthase [Myxococcota bacterium]
MSRPHPEERRILVDPELVGVRLDVAVQRAMAWSRSASQHAIEDGAVYVDDHRCRVPAQLLTAGQTIRVLPTAPDRTQVGGGRLRVVHEDRALLVVDKPAGLPTQPPPRGGDALSLRVQKYLERKGTLRAGEVHRLDRDASGLVVYGRSRSATASLAEQFRLHTAGRHYLAIVRTALPVLPQVIDEPLAELGPGRMTLDPTGMPARTFVLPLAFDPERNAALVLCALDTGRTHQVRVHLAFAVGPIAGDVMYGDLPSQGQPSPGLDNVGEAGESSRPGRIALHGGVLSLDHPDGGQPRTWVAAPGDDFWALVPGAVLPLPDGWAELDPRHGLANGAATA